MTNSIAKTKNVIISIPHAASTRIYGGEEFINPSPNSWAKVNDHYNHIRSLTEAY